MKHLGTQANAANLLCNRFRAAFGGEAEEKLADWVERAERDGRPGWRITGVIRHDVAIAPEDKLALISQRAEHTGGALQEEI